jgi:cytochrome d ubiquinol oxidase subunit I
LPDNKWLLRALVIAAPMGMIAIECGWTVTEVGRQPWIIYGVMRTAFAVTPMPGLVVPFVTFTLLYLFLAVIVVWLLLRQVAASPRIANEDAEHRAGKEKAVVVS